jgi:hypothetical protein
MSEKVKLDEDHARFRAHCEETLEDVLAEQDALPAFNWFERISGKRESCATECPHLRTGLGLKPDGTRTVHLG